MFHVSCIALSSLSNDLKSSWPGQTRHFSPNGSVTAIPILKKSPSRKGGHSLRRRSQLPPGPHALPDLGAPGLAATNPYHRTEKHLEDNWHHRTLRRSVPLPLPDDFQRRDLHRLSRKDTAQPRSPQNLSDPRQCVIPQGQHCVDLVLTTSQIYGSLQSSSLFSRAQRAGANLASCSSPWHPQSLFCNPRRTALGIDFHVSQHPEKFPTGPRLFTALSITPMSRYLCNDI
jgi:hypothetical protein